jgi:hypothetical protein
MWDAGLLIELPGTDILIPPHWKNIQPAIKVILPAGSSMLTL